MAQFTRKEAVAHIEFVGLNGIDLASVIPKNFSEAIESDTTEALRIGYIVGICVALDLCDSDFEMQSKELH